MATKKNLSWHKKRAWASFSLFIRTRDSLKTTGSLDNCVCVTCGRTYPRLGVGCIQAGHFVSGRTNAVLFDERGVNGQCYGCNSNMGRKGAGLDYWVWMETNHGRPVIDELMKNRHLSQKITALEYDEIAELYKQKTKDLTNNK